MAQPGSPLALLTDLYELTMAQAYWEEQMFAPATFSLFIRDYPADRGYFVAAGLEAVLDYLESFRFGGEELDCLASTGTFSADFLHFLSGVRFQGEVWALPEGRPFFVDEPILEVTGPIIEAQVVETYVQYDGQPAARPPGGSPPCTGPTVTWLSSSSPAHADSRPANEKEPRRQED
ncbi:MAG: hypothetical protein AB1578_15240 [Thermodesulfobacteriota bacterium]|jgi:nicotinate phosphoribosyltransferase